MQFIHRLDTSASARSRARPLAPSLSPTDRPTHGPPTRDGAQTSCFLSAGPPTTFFKSRRQHWTIFMNPTKAVVLPSAYRGAYIITATPTSKRPLRRDPSGLAKAVQHDAPRSRAGRRVSAMRRAMPQTISGVARTTDLETRTRDPIRTASRARRLLRRCLLQSVCHAAVADGVGKAEKSGQRQRRARPLRAGETEGEFGAVAAREEHNETSDRVEPDDAPQHRQRRKLSPAKAPDSREYRDCQDDFVETAVVIGEVGAGDAGVWMDVGAGPTAGRLAGRSARR